MNLENYRSYLEYILIGIIGILLFLIIRSAVENKRKAREGFLGLGDSSSSSPADSSSSSPADSSSSSPADSSSDDSDDPVVKTMQSNIDALNDATKITIDALNLVKYRSHWENLIVAMEDRISSISLQAANLLAAKMKANPNDDVINQIIEKINGLNKYGDTLKGNMKYLDGLK